MRSAIVVSVVVLMVAFLTVPGLLQHCRQVPKDIGRAIDQTALQLSPEHMESIIEEDLNRAERELRDHYVKVYKLKAKITELESTLRVQKQELEKKERMLQRAKELLSQHKPGSIIMVANTSWSWEQVNQDAFNLLSTCKTLRVQIEGNEQALQRLQQAYDEGLKTIAASQEKLRRMKLEFDAKKAELAALRTIEEVNALVSSVKTIGSLEAKSDFSFALKAYEEYLNELRAKAEYDQKILIKGPTLIPWAEEVGVETSTVSEIESYFQQGSSTEKPSPKEAPKEQPEFPKEKAPAVKENVAHTN